MLEGNSWVFRKQVKDPGGKTWRKGLFAEQTLQMQESSRV